MAQQQQTTAPRVEVERLLSLAWAFACAFAAELIFVAKFSFESAGRMAIVFVLLLVLHRYARLALNQYQPQRSHLLVLGGVILGSLAMLWIGRLLVASVGSYITQHQLLPHLEIDNLYFALPFAAGGLILQSVLGLHYGFVFAGVTAVITSVYFPHDPLLAPYAFSGVLVACAALRRIRSRSSYLRAGLQIGLFSIPIALGSLILDNDLTLTEFLLRPLLALLGGVLAAFIASGITPLIEYLSGHVTDLKLIEMATLDHPLLKELSIQAPGTWNHSMVMGMMAESAAEAIGANPVAARVGAYFHDVGKVSKPAYFAENQFGEGNRHDKLSPSMSALIIRAHVKEGLELAAKHNLPRVIADMIPQHHGTSLIEYFYEKALTEAEELGKEKGVDPEPVDINLYTYPGPKPQTREAGILMLADGIEAASRTLSEPTDDRLQGLVQKMINKVFASGELDETDLTLNDLHKIAKCFTRVLHGIYHQRVAYHEPAEKTAEDDAPVRAGSTETADEQPERPKEDLKRLGCE